MTDMPTPDYPTTVYLLMTPTVDTLPVDVTGSIETRVFVSLEAAKLGALHRFIGEIDPATLPNGDPIEWEPVYGGAFVARYQDEDMRIESAFLEDQPRPSR